ncbi:hypothetical protein [Klebsiella pneumoniae]|uniref:hypothetical protein n=1 Tax=Klebsiella pneumoniae TaxID=573 RepID=UPI002949BF9C|nr:hypothetical protein [Klebsiella pneumoniae]MDV5663160.1 hypothetical protein [Klebsiella pneumoniae]
MDKIQGYVGALHGNLWVRCTATYGFVARNKYENASNINALNDNSERLNATPLLIAIQDPKDLYIYPFDR